MYEEQADTHQDNERSRAATHEAVSLHEPSNGDEGHWIFHDSLVSLGDNRKSIVQISAVCIGNSMESQIDNCDIIRY